MGARSRGRWVRAGVVSAAGAVAVLAGGLPGDLRAEEDPRTFDGWVVTEGDRRFRFEEKDGWRREVGRDGFALRSTRETVAFYGTFRAEQVQRTKPSDLFDGHDFRGGWVVDQHGEERTYARKEQWTGSRNADGFVLQRRGQQIWYYGDFRVHEHTDLP